jgi:hypothetical protein
MVSKSPFWWLGSTGGDMVLADYIAVTGCSECVAMAIAMACSLRECVLRSVH